MSSGPDARLRLGEYPRSTLDFLIGPARWLAGRRWELALHAQEHVPMEGPVILASNHVGLIDGPLLAILGPRPVHALTKQEMFDGRAGRVLRASGQIRLDRYGADPAAVKACVRVLDAGEVVGIFPEGTRGDGELHRIHRGAAFLALVSGAPVVPVTMFGTRQPGAGNHALPPKGGRIDVVYGEPWRVAAQPWPRTREQVGAASALLHQHLRSALEGARDLTGRELPGPLPAHEQKDDPGPGSPTKEHHD